MIFERKRVSEMTPEFLLGDMFYRGTKFLLFNEDYYTQSVSIEKRNFNMM